MYLVKVINYEYGERSREYRIEATNPATAAARAFRQAKKEKIFGRHRLKEWTIKITKI